MHAHANQRVDLYMHTYVHVQVDAYVVENVDVYTCVQVYLPRPRIYDQVEQQSSRSPQKYILCLPGLQEYLKQWPNNFSKEPKWLYLRLVRAAAAPSSGSQSMRRAHCCGLLGGLWCIWANSRTVAVLPEREEVRSHSAAFRCSWQALGHQVWTSAYKTSDLFAWLLRQKKLKLGAEGSQGLLAVYMLQGDFLWASSFW